MKNNPLYRKYLESDEWKVLRDKVIARDGSKCTKEKQGKKDG